VDNTMNTNVLMFNLSLNTRETTDFHVTPISTTMEYTQYKGTITIPEEPSGTVVSISVVTTTTPRSFSVTAQGKETFYFLTSISTSLDSLDPNKSAFVNFLDARNDLVNLHGTHVDAWSNIWQSRIEISGDFRLSQVVNASQYYILNSVRQDWPYSLSPGSLASNGYNGHVFWDCETWMYPALLLTHPDIANGGLLQYRFDRMKGAAKKALSYNRGYSGLMFPWESAFTGEEVCPSSAPTGELEQHISGDIVFAFRQYYYLTKDLVWLENVYPLIAGVARFWSSRVVYDAIRDQYLIDGVIPPDEYAVNVNNSVYTNVVASISLDFAVFCGKLLNRATPAIWTTIGSKLRIPLNTTLMLHPEYDNYKGETIKQADVILLGFPLMYSMATVLRKNDLVYYQERTDRQGPAMTYAMETIAWLELGNMDEASKVWDEAWANAHDPFMVWTETPTGGTVNFITGAGGFLQAVLFGYGGIRLSKDMITFSPQLPPLVKAIQFGQINYLNNKLRISFDDKTVSVTKTNPEGQSLSLKTSLGDTFSLIQNKTATFPRGPFSVSSQ